MLLVCTHVVTHLCTVSLGALNFFPLSSVCITTPLILNPSQFLNRDKLCEQSAEFNCIFIVFFYIYIYISNVCFFVKLSTLFV